MFFSCALLSQITDYLTMCVLAGGGFRSMVLCDDVSIVVLGDKTAMG